ncbi:MAG: hypothetical protein Q3M24_13735 [Candidatus Electrothrix aestuarii]|uniref:Uncharacterized protein n=1 Tax=Candidatus Electrothrix aestuarii TaxID=3062594 RepID=A0AAU8LQ24_9BACT|nr:hypothetical protein [Candidatus Electrothrix aestuarii]
MPYTVKDYLREVTLDNLDTLTPEERLRGISLEEGLKYFFPDESEEKKRTILQKLLKEEQNNGKKE